MKTSNRPAFSTALAVRIYLSGLLVLAAVVLIVLLLLIRAERVADTDTPFVTPEFMALFAGALVLAVLPALLVRFTRMSDRLGRLSSLQRILVSLGALLAAAAGALVVGSVGFIAPYAAPLILWLMLVWVALAGGLLFGSDSGEAETSAADVQRLRKPVGRVVLLLTLSLVVPLLIGELGLRFYFGLFGSEAQKISYLYSADDIERLTTRFRGVPYVNFGLSPEFESHNALGYRGPTPVIPKPEGTFRIVTMGGSTTYGFAMTHEESYPAQLERILFEEYGYTQIEVVNAGVPYYTSWETLANLQFRVLDLQPDLLLIYDGINDLNARAHLPENYAGIPASAGLWSTRQPDPGWSTLYRFLAINLRLMPDPAALTTRFVSWRPDVTCCEQYSDAEIAAHFSANPPIYFERNLRNVAAIADTFGFQVVFSSWTYYPDPTANDMNLMARDYRQDAIAEQNEVLRRLGEETSAAFYDLHTAFPYNPDFWLPDGIHMTPAGTLEQARLYAQFLVQAELLPAP